MTESCESAEQDACEFRLKLLKDEISAQANMFDQIDSKTGVALGFTFVVVGQVLASVFRIATDQNLSRVFIRLSQAGSSALLTYLSSAPSFAEQNPVGQEVSSIVSSWRRRT
jgi:hypothetical protein